MAMSGVSDHCDEPSPDCTRLIMEVPCAKCRRNVSPIHSSAYIDGQANRNANELARQAADKFARDFKCGKDEVKVIGEKGAAVSLAKR